MCKIGTAGWIRRSLCGRPRCSASWPVWTRRTVTRLVGFTGDDALYSLFLSSGLRCSASWLVWIRRTVCSDTVVLVAEEVAARSSSTSAVVCLLPVLLMMMQVLCSHRLWQAHVFRIMGSVERPRSGRAHRRPRQFHVHAVWREVRVGCGYGFVGTDCAFALRGMVLLMATALWARPSSLDVRFF